MGNGQSCNRMTSSDAMSDMKTPRPARHRPMRAAAAGSARLLLVTALATTTALARMPQQPATQSFHDAVASAWARLPQRQDFAAQQGAASARYTAGGAVFPNAPSLNGSYINDKIAGSNYNYITTQIELSTPIWLPGQGTATQNTAQADNTAIAAASEAAHLALASEVLDLATQAMLAANARDVAIRRLATARVLASELARRFRVGESSESDALAADADAAMASVTLTDADTRLGLARAALAVIVGTDMLPRLAVSGASTPVGMTAAALARHPRIAAAERSLAAVQASARQVRIENRDAPEIGVQGINEKQPGSRWDTRFGVVLRLPFATDTRNAPRRAAAEQATTQAAVQLALTRREVLAGVRQAEAVLAGAERGTVAAARAASELERRRGQIDRAWRMGEMPLVEVVRANAVAFDAGFARDKALTELSAARLRLQLAEGVLP